MRYAFTYNLSINMILISLMFASVALKTRKKEIISEA